MENLIEKYLTTEDVQKIFGLKSARATRALMNVSGFPTMRLGKYYRVDRKELVKWMAQNSRSVINFG